MNNNNNNNDNNNNNNNNNLRGAIRIRYNIPLKRLPPLCLCGDSFNLQHALSCSNWGLVITRHKELRNLAAEILGEVCKNVVIELWIIRQTAFCDVMVFNPLSRCHLHHSLPAVHKRMKTKKNGNITSQFFNAAISFRILLNVFLTEGKNLKVRSVYALKPA